MNRLNLNFSLNSIEDRRDFINSYLNEFIKENQILTKKELETCADYILWGKESDGLNLVQKKELQIDTRHDTWKADAKVDSLEELLDNAVFSENSILYPNEPPVKIVRRVFDREKELNRAPSYLKEELSNLFKQIDRTELLINFYELHHGKRKNPPREELFSLFTQNEILDLEEKGQDLTQFSYLKLKHLLVELRRQQYGIKDLYAPLLFKDSNSMPRAKPEETFTFETDVPVFPLGLKSRFNKDSLFKDWLNPQDLKLSELKEISNLIWEKKKKEKELQLSGKRFFDFRKPSHLKQLIKFYYELEDMALRRHLQNTTIQFLNTFYFYVRKANLNEIQTEILKLKLKRFQNKDIAAAINSKFNKNYTRNYISTIFYRQVLKEISLAAERHLEFMENVFFPENFKTCTFCGRSFLRNQNNFTRKKVSHDGFSTRCKRCDKLKRQGLLKRNKEEK